MRFILATLLLCASTIASAQYIPPPYNGFYWDPAQPGKGYSVESQDDFVFIAFYNYDTDSEPTFYVVQGRWDGVNRRLIGAELLQVSNGPCVACTFVPTGPIVNLGPITVEFPQRDRGRITYQNRVTNIVPFLFNYTTNAQSYMRGIWHTTEGSLGVYFGDRLRVTGPCNDCGSTLVEPFIGRRFDGSSSRILIGSVIPSNGRIFILLDSSASFYSEFILTVGVNDFSGTTSTYRKGENPTGSLPAFGSRFVGPTGATALYGSAAAASDKARDQLNETIAKMAAESSEAFALSAEEAAVREATHRAMERIAR